MALGGPLLGASDRQVRTSAAAARSSPPPGMHLELGAPLSGSWLHHNYVALRVARLNARTRSKRLAHAVPGGRILLRLRRASALRRRRTEIGCSYRCHRDKDQTSKPWDVSTALRDVRNVPERPEDVNVTWIG